jgi:hypothetical protein
MHAGEALWQLYAALEAIHKRANNGAVTLLVEKSEEFCAIIGTHLQTGLPPVDQRSLRAAALIEGLETLAKDEQSSNSLTNSEAKEAFDLALGILEDLDRLPAAAADFSESVGEKVASMRDFIVKYDRVSPAQLKALQNMRGGVDRWLESDSRRSRSTSMRPNDDMYEDSSMLDEETFRLDQDAHDGGW